MQLDPQMQASFLLSHVKKEKADRNKQDQENQEGSRVREKGRENYLIPLYEVLHKTVQ